jgi:hypothetical protein
VLKSKFTGKFLNLVPVWHSLLKSEVSCLVCYKTHPQIGKLSRTKILKSLWISTKILKLLSELSRQSCTAYRKKNLLQDTIIFLAFVETH